MHILRVLIGRREVRRATNSTNVQVITLSPLNVMTKQLNMSTTKLFTSSYIPTLERKNNIESDKYIWHLHLTVTFDIHNWHLYLTVTFGIYIWHLALTFISDISIWHLCLTFLFYIHIWHLSLTFTSDISIWNLCLACGSIHFPRLFSKQSWKMYWIAKPFVLPLHYFSLRKTIHFFKKLERNSPQLWRTGGSWLRQ